MNGPGIRGVLALAGLALLLAGCSQEATDWKQASTANSIEAYQQFLKQHPHGADSQQAQTRLVQLSEQRDWQIAAAANTRDAYQQFVAQHPSSQWAQEARIRIENFAQAGVSGGLPPPGAASAVSGSPTTAPPASAAAPTPTPAPVAAAAPPSVPAAPAGRSRLATAGAHQRPVHHEAMQHAHVGSTARARLARLRAHGARTVQLGAYRTRARAQAGWRRLAARFAPLRGLKPSYVAVHARGQRLYRLEVRLASPAAASGLCARLKRHALACVRVNA